MGPIVGSPYFGKRPYSSYETTYYGIPRRGINSSSILGTILIIHGFLSGNQASYWGLYYPQTSSTHMKYTPLRRLGSFPVNEESNLKESGKIKRTPAFSSGVWGLGFRDYRVEGVGYGCLSKVWAPTMQPPNS